MTTESTATAAAEAREAAQSVTETEQRLKALETRLQREVQEAWAAEAESRREAERRQA